MEQSRISFYDEIRRNKRNSVILIFAVVIVLVLLGYVIGLILGQDYFVVVMVLTVIITLIYVLVGYYNSDKIAIASVNAKLVSSEDRRFRQYYDLVEGLRLASGLPMPKLYVMENPQINAFASGRDPQHSVVCVTTGAIEKLNKQELEGVLAHELSHISNYDIRFMTLTAVLVGMVAIISQIFIRSLWFGSMNRGGNDRNQGNAILMVIGIVLAILAPLLVSLVQLAISRKREYSADASAVKFVRSPTGLIGALEKIKSNQDMKVSGAVAPLFLAKPSRSSELFQTHPSLEKRIEKLKKM